MTLWLAAFGGILLFLIGTTAGKYYLLVNTLWLAYTLGLTGLVLMWLRHVQKNLNNLLLESPDPDLPMKSFPVKINQFASVDLNIGKLYCKLKNTESDLINQKARQAGENFNLMLSSTTDRLTGVPNRGEIDKNLDKLIRRMNPFSVVMMDIDHFKKVNDTYGHDIGDLVLKQFAVTVKNSIRPMDFLGRYGGEEFMIICDAGLAEAAEIAERVRQAVSAAQIRFSEGRTLLITASFGVAEFKAGDTASALVKRADEALYKAKQSGRNRVCKEG